MSITRSLIDMVAVRYQLGMISHLHSGMADVLDAGQVTTFFGHPLRWTLNFDASTFDVTMKLLQDETLDGPQVDTEHAPNELHLTLTNFDGTDGRGTATPMLLGELGEDLLFLHFRVFRFGATADYTVHYTFYRAEKSAVGWRVAHAAPEEL